MPNTYFQFKQFTVQQEKCAMKVTTDACLFGAWLAKMLQMEQLPAGKVLDIGAGTGLLSLMVAQKNAIHQYEAIEIDQSAYEQCVSNFANAPFNQILTAIAGDAANFTSDEKYRFIFSNPPFYEKDLLSPQTNINLARHNSGLSFEILLNCICSNIATNGLFAVLIPFHRTMAFEEIALKKGFFLLRKVLVKQSPEHAYFRSFLLFGKVQYTLINKEEIIIAAAARNTYSECFITLLEDYYMYL